MILIDRVNDRNTIKISESCHEEADIAIGANDVGSPSNNLANVQECRTYCSSVSGANYFTFTSHSRQCFCKTLYANINAMFGAVSGEIICTATTLTTAASTTTTITTAPGTTTTTTIPACLIEYDFNYGGNDLGKIEGVSDFESCLSSCKTAYPSALYFTLNQHNGNCWCKTSASGRYTTMGTISGEINCTGKSLVRV